MLPRLQDRLGPHDLERIKVLVLVVAERRADLGDEVFLDLVPQEPLLRLLQLLVGDRSQVHGLVPPLLLLLSFQISLFLGQVCVTF